jgi:putative ABC transport system ATP-binding protein
MNQTTNNALTVKNVSKRVSIANGKGNEGKQLSILTDVNLNVTSGDSLAIVGASGSGKSTLLGLLAGLDLPSEGEINLLGNNIHQLDEEQRAQIRRSEVGFIFQQFLLVPSLTALENVMLPAELSDSGELRNKAEELALAWLEKVGLSHRLDHFPNQLSGGEQQRVAIARAFITSPKLLFADEPSANLDTENGKLIEDLLFELNQSASTTLILVTHDPELAQRCQRIVNISAGKLNEIQKENNERQSLNPNPDSVNTKAEVAEAIADAS